MQCVCLLLSVCFDLLNFIRQCCHWFKNAVLDLDATVLLSKNFSDPLVYFIHLKKLSDRQSLQKCTETETLPTATDKATKPG